MRKVLLLALTLVFAKVGFCQVNEAANNAAMQLVRGTLNQVGLPGNNADEVKVSSTYVIPGTDITMVYLQQTFQGVPVYNQMKTLAFRGGKLISNMGAMEPSIAKLSGNASSLPSVSPVNALDAAFKEAGTKALEPAVPLSTSDNGNKMKFGRLGASSEMVTADLIWMPNAKGEYKLAWQVFVAPIKSSDYWLIRVDAQTGKVLNKENLTVTCKWDNEKHSVAEHIEENHQKTKNHLYDNYVIQRSNKNNKWEYNPFIVNTATYKVIKYPAESPNHPGGLPSDHTDPWLLTPGNATTLKWHTGAGATDYDITRGNNVWAQEDRDANNATFGIPGNTTTALPNLTFPVVYDITQGPLVGNNQQAAIVNLFYMNNLMHDMAYRYGFDEVAGNFQDDNLGRGGAGIDYVIADAQDAGGTNNANFGTPADGGRPRMQMFLWVPPTSPNPPNRDGDIDNGVIAHEYGHGISNRFTGGPANVSCLGNAEQGGEGWSDYMALMMGTNWATATVNDGNDPTKPRGIGTYVLGQPITGVGIRVQPYSTNMSVFNLTYSNLPAMVVPHGVGTVWCGMIWEMTWEIIRQDNFIETNFLNPAGAISTWRGNAAAMKLVMEGMRLQACSPGFVDARNAILAADAALFAGRYNCAIWRAFAKRGLGRNASQGASTSSTDGVADFTVDAGLFAFNPNLASVFEGSTLIYTNNITAGQCTPMTNFVLRDTLPLSVTYVPASGGTYTGGDRVVSFPVNQAINTTQAYSFSVTVNPGTYFAPATHINDPVTAIAPNWTATSTTVNVWSTSGVSVRSAPLAFFSPDAAVSSEQILRTTAPILLPSGPSAFSSLSFWHRFSTEAGFDGGVVEISTNGGATWTDLGSRMSGLRYTGTLSAANTFLGGRSAFVGNSGAAFQETRINLGAFAGQSVLIRFRFASDPSVGGAGWFIDDIVMQSAPFVYTKSGLYDNLNIRVNYKDSLTPITLALCADPPSFEVVSATQPTCAGQLTGSIFVDGFGTEAVEYSINGGATFQATGTFNGLAAGSYNVVIRYIARPTCITTHPGNPVVINALTGTPVITAPTVTQPLCPVFTGTIVVNATGTGTLEYSVNGAAGPWQLSATFGLLAPGSYNIAARLQATPGCISLYSGNPVVINPVVAPVVVTQPLNKVICQNGNTTFTITDNNPVPAPTYQWQISTAGAGGPWTNLANVAPFSGVTTTTLVVTGAGIIYNGNFFRCVVTNVCGPTPSNGASLTVNPLPIVNNGPSGLCAPVTLTASGNANTYVWTPAGGLNTTTGPTVIATPTTTTVYTVTGTITATGCQNSASVTVLGTPVTPVVSPAAPVICAGDIQPLTVAPSMMTVTYSGASLAIPAPPSTGAGTGAPASVYPATVTVSGLPATGARVKSVSLNGLSHTFPADMDILLQHSPTSTNVVVLSDVGGATDIVNGNIVLDDAAATLAPAILVSGTYRPTNPAGTDQFPAPGPGGLTQTNLPLSTFTGNLNGIWNLFVTDDAGVDIGSLNNWSITFEVPTALWSPATGLYTNPAATTPYVLGTPASTVYFQQSPTVQTAYTYTVTNTLGTCTAANTGSVTVTVNPLPVFTVTPDNQCTPVTLTAAGNATTYSWSPAYGLNTTTGTTVTATPPLNTTYSVLGTITTTGCTATQTVTANATPATPVVTPTAISICEGAVTQLSVAPTAITTQNGGTITIPAGAPTTTSGPASPYPATMAIGGLPASGVRVKSVQINGISHTFPSDVDMMLRSPSGTNVTLMSDAGGSTVVSAANLVFDDAAAAVLPAAIVSGTYKPTNIGAADTYPAPGPGAITDATPALANFTGNLNGTWNLYINDQVGGDVGNITSWSITFEITGALWTPAATLFTNAAGVIPYVAGTMASPVYAKPTITTVYSATRATATCTSGTATSTVTVYNPIVITTHPATQTVCEGVNVTFSVVHSGNFPAYQWQLSTDNGTTWGPIAGANSSSITLPAVTTALSGRRYRVVITNTCTTVTSNAAILTVNPLSTVVATDLFTQRICISDTLVPLVGTPVGGSWSGIGVSGFNFVPGATAIGGPYVLTYTYTNTFGCTTTDTTSVRVVDCPERIRLLRNDGAVLYPNPNNGNFFIRMNSVLYSYLAMDVYTSAGHLVSRKQFGGLVYGRVIPVNLTHLPTGIYLVKLYYDDGVRTSEKTFEVMIGRQ